MIRWSPTSNVFCMDSEGITRACPTAPLISRNTRPTQNHATISRQTFCSIVSSGGVFLFSVFLSCAFLAFTFHHHRSIVSQLSETCSFAHFQLHQFRRIVPRITRRTEIAFGVVHRLPQPGQRNVAQ